MMSKSISIATARRIPMEKWWPVKILTARESGFIPAVSRKRYCQTSGTVVNAPNKKRRLGTLSLEVFS